MPSCLLTAVHHCTPPRARAIPAQREQRDEARRAVRPGAPYYTRSMPTRVSAAIDLERDLLTAEEFLEWLEPGRSADLLD